MADTLLILGCHVLQNVRPRQLYLGGVAPATIEAQGASCRYNKPLRVPGDRSPLTRFDMALIPRTLKSIVGMAEDTFTERLRRTPSMVPCV